MPTYSLLLAQRENVPLTTVDSQVVTVAVQNCERLVVQIHNTSTTARTVKTTVSGRLKSNMPWSLFTSENGGQQPVNVTQGVSTMAAYSVHGLLEIKIDCRVLTGTGSATLVIRAGSR